MRRKPWSLIILTLGHLFAPIGNQFFNALWSPMPMSFYLRIAFQPANIQKNWAEWVFPVIAAAAIYICKRWSFFIYVTAMGSLFISSYLGFHDRTGQGIGFELFLAYTFNILLVWYFLIPAVREIYFNPRLRWWEADDRYRADLPVTFKSQNEIQAGEIGNISIGGLFLKSKYLPNDAEQIPLDFEFKGTKYHFTGEVIRHGNQDAIGFGLRFQHNPGSIRLAKHLVKILDSEGRLLASRLPGKEDGFAFWLKRLLTTGKGLTPEKGPRTK